MWPELVNPFAWWQWLVLAAVPPAIVALYFLKLKRRPVEVPSTFLWHKSIEDLHVNSIWQRLRNNLLLLLQLLLLLLLFFALLQPYWQSEKLPGNRFILLIDNSASMQAKDVAPSRLDEAKRQALELIEQLKSGDVAMIVSFSDIARVEQSFSDNRRELRRAVEGVLPTARPTSLAEALKVAAGLANPPRLSDKESDRDVQVAEPLPATLVIFSDGRFDDVPDFHLGNLEPVYRSVGSSDAKNVGIVMMSVRRHEARPDQVQVFARLQNFSQEPVAASLELRFNDTPIDYRRVEIPPKTAEGPGEEQVPAFNLTLAGAGKLELRATTDDALSLDDRAWVAVNPPRKARVLLVTPGNERLLLALTTGTVAEAAQTVQQPPDYLAGDEYRQQAALGAYDVVIYDRCQPKELPRANTLFIGSMPQAGGWSAGEEVRAPSVIDVDPTHPLTQWLDLGDVFFTHGTPLNVPPAGRVLIDSDNGPLLAISPREGFEDAVLGAALYGLRQEDGEERPYGSNWMFKASFPVFVLNSMYYLGGGQAGQSEATYRPGQQVPVESPVPGAPLQIATPQGRTVQIREASAGPQTFADTAELGIYEVSSSGKNVHQFAVNLFQPAESDLPPRPEINLSRTPIGSQAGSEITRTEVWKLLILGGLFVLLLEWYIYNRRVSL